MSPLPAPQPEITGPELTGEEAVTLRVMTFNIWLGGSRIDFDQVAEAIRAADADIVGLQEGLGSHPKIADALGWHHAPDHGRRARGLDAMQQPVISRYPLISSPDPAAYVYAQIDPDRVVAVSNVHLTAYPYAPHELRDGASAQKALELEDDHLTELTTRFRLLPELAAAGMPVFLTGDFNVPSHLDWNTAAAAEAEPFRTEFAWPVSTRLGELGFRDSYREFNPDPVTRPGITWSPGYPPPQIDDDEVLDRIDFVYTAGPTTTIGSQIVGEQGPDTDISIPTWPSDHRAVVSEFQVVPHRVSR